MQWLKHLMFFLVFLLLFNLFVSGDVECKTGKSGKKQIKNKQFSSSVNTQNVSNQTVETNTATTSIKEVVPLETCLFILPKEKIDGTIEKLLFTFNLKVISYGPFYAFYGKDKDTILILVDEVSIRTKQTPYLVCLKKDLPVKDTVKEIIRELPEYRAYQSSLNERFSSLLLAIKNATPPREDVEINRELMMNDLAKVVQEIELSCGNVKMTKVEEKTDAVPYSEIKKRAQAIYDICPVNSLKEFIDNL